ncbi:hypothetical protein EIP91_011165 [Steccherinum ochraceum]|uniref:Uncharacterized protein n=1 Tax=Steccherinum ochraceum TaxID=92696 RepID=A0A4R0RL75_9APHY|nr:hypothetical protein EIP91_011165 [Steccherinum ochraceum]
MAPEIRFTPYGIPYVVEFGNVSFRKRSKSGSSSLAPTICGSSSTINLASHIAATRPDASTPTLVITPPEADGEGLFVGFASHQAYSYRRLSETRLARLKHRIANAVIAAGMDAPPPRAARLAERCVSHGRVHTSELRRAGEASPVPSSLYQGTYGQVMSAFKSAGLITAPCNQLGFADAQRLGALFVVKHTDLGTVELTKLTLWA